MSIVLTVVATENTNMDTILMEENTMSELKECIHNEQTGLDYLFAEDYCIPAIELPEDDDLPIGRWVRMHKTYLEKTNLLLFNHLILTGELHTYLADINEQTQDRYQLIVRQMAKRRA